MKEDSIEQDRENAVKEDSIEQDRESAVKEDSIEQDRENAVKEDSIEQDRESAVKKDSIEQDRESAVKEGNMERGDCVKLKTGERICIADGRTGDEEEIMALYRSAVGTAGCTWSEDYPNEDILRDDIARGALYCARSEDGGIIAVISVDDDPKVDALRNWSNYDDCLADKGGEYAAELARLAVREDYRNLGVAREMILYATERVQTGNSCKPRAKYVHYLVSQKNERALRSYAKLCWENRGEASLFGEKWLCYEKCFEDGTPARGKAARLSGGAKSECD